MKNIFIQGLLDWKMPLFRGALYAVVPALTSTYAGLQDYKSMSDMDDLTWLKIKLSAMIAAGTALAGYLDSSFTRTRDRLRERSGAELEPPAPTAP